MKHNLLTWNSGNNGGNSISLTANDQNSQMDLYKIDALIEKHPELLKELGWEREDIVTFFDSNLLLGEQREEKGVDELYISEKSLERLVEYLRSLDELKSTLRLPDDSGQH